MIALVTGGGGFLGSAIVKRLVERGDDVRTFSRGKYEFLSKLCVRQDHGDLEDYDAVAASVAGADIVFHVAAKAGVWGRWHEYFGPNVIGTRNVLRACREQGVRKLVFTGSPSATFAGVDQNGVDESEPYPIKFLAHYPHTKAIAEREVLAANGPDLATVSLRPHLIWGPGDPHLAPRMIERARAGKLKRIGSASKLVDTVYIDNAADAHLLAVDRLDIGSPVAGKAYYISQGEPEPMWDFVGRILDAAGVPRPTKVVSPTVAYIAATVLESVYRLFGIRSEPVATRFVVKQLTTAHWYDLTAARRDLGYQPAVSTDEGMCRFKASINSPT